MLNFGERTGGSPYGAEGIFINKGKITSARDVSGEPIEAFGGESYECGVEIVMDIEGLQWPKTMSMGGKFKRDDTGAVEGWGSAFPVNDLFIACAVRGSLNDDGTIPAGVLDELVGKEIYFLTYTTGLKENQKLKTSTWKTVHGVEDGADTRLYERFKKSLAKGYPKNYKHPNELPRSDSFEYGANAPAPVATQAAAYDEDPF